MKPANRPPLAVNRLIARLFFRTLSRPGEFADFPPPGWLYKCLGLFGRVFLTPYDCMPRSEFAVAILIALALFSALLAAGGFSLYGGALAAWPLYVPLIALAFILMFILFVAWPIIFSYLYAKRLADAGFVASRAQTWLLQACSFLLLASGVVLFFWMRFLPLILLPHVVITLLLFIPPSRPADRQS